MIIALVTIAFRCILLNNGSAQLVMTLRRLTARQWLDGVAATALSSLSCTVAMSVAAQLNGAAQDTPPFLSMIANVSPVALFAMTIIPCGAPVFAILMKGGSARALKIYVGGFCLAALAGAAYMSTVALWV